MSPRRWAGAALALVALPGAAVADPVSRVSLSWVRLEGASSCIAPQTLARAVEERIGQRVFVPLADADLSIEAHIARTSEPEGWRATLQSATRAGVTAARVITREALDCAAIDTAVVLALSLMIRAADVASTAPRLAAPPPEPAPSATRAAPRLGASSRRLLYASVGTWGALAPGLSAVGRLGVRLPIEGVWGTELSAGISYAEAIDGAARYDANAWGAALLTWSPASLRWLQVGVGPIVGAAFTEAQSRASAAPWAGVVAQVSGQVSLARWLMAGVSAQLVVPLVAPRWVLRDASGARATERPGVASIGPGVDVFIGVTAW